MCIRDRPWAAKIHPLPSPVINQEMKFKHNNKKETLTVRGWGHSRGRWCKTKKKKYKGKSCHWASLPRLTFERVVLRWNCVPQRWAISKKACFLVETHWASFGVDNCRSKVCEEQVTQVAIPWERRSDRYQKSNSAESKKTFLHVVTIGIASHLSLAWIWLLLVKCRKLSPVYQFLTFC